MCSQLTCENLLFSTVCIYSKRLLVDGSHGFLTNLLSRTPFGLRLSVPFYRELIMEVDYSQRWSLISNPPGNAGYNIWINILGQSFFQT